ncbi:TetR/AcrR family transcriptional regulator [Janibacter indicus]|uniref:TetR/AcrR family transcriptional regulator n=1 Tax=Janibacter indicus TaxID=857417 RepID=UPI003EBAF5EC
MNSRSTDTTPRERRKLARRQQIVELARQIAEADGWEAVTTRRLADGIDFSQPVLYQHFSSREDVIRTVTLQGFADLEQRVRALDAGIGDRRGLEAVCHTYLGFVREHPRLYDAMFTNPTPLPFADTHTPPELTGAFNALTEHVARQAPHIDDAGAAAELLWACCHGLATLQASARIPADRIDEHIGHIDRMITRRGTQGEDPA